MTRNEGEPRQVHAEKARVKLERAVFLDGLLRPDEALVARGAALLVTTHRIVCARRPLGGRGWAEDAFAYEALESWQLIRNHDARPILVLSHQPRLRPTIVPARGLFGKARRGRVSDVLEATSWIWFSSPRDPVFKATIAQLRKEGIREEPEAERRVAGRREERLHGRVVPTLTKAELSWRVDRQARTDHKAKTHRGSPRWVIGSVSTRSAPNGRNG